jgi:transposase
MDTSHGRRRYRSWPEALKREIVAATWVPGASVSMVARHYDVNANQVFAWRRRYGPGSAERAALRLMPVTVTPDKSAEPAPASASIEVELSGARVRIPISTPSALAAAVVGALR